MTSVEEVGVANAEVANAAEEVRDAGTENAGPVYCGVSRGKRKARVESIPVQVGVEALLAERETAIKHEVPGAKAAPTTLTPVLRPKGTPHPVLAGGEAPPRPEQRHDVVEASRVALGDDRAEVRFRSERDRRAREAVNQESEERGKEGDDEEDPWGLQEREGAVD